MRLTNAQHKLITSLHYKKYRDEHRLFIVEGLKSIDTALAAGAKIELVVTSDDFTTTHGVAKLASRFEESVLVSGVESSAYKKLSNLSTPPGILAVVGYLDEPQDIGMKVLVLDGITDPGNMGTLIRTADWFGFDSVLIGRGSVDMYNSKVVQATMGSIFNLSFRENIDLKKEVPSLVAQGYDCIATVLDGVHELPHLKDKRAVLMGSESHGLSDEVASAATVRYTIAGGGGAESLNVAVAAGIVMAEIHI